MLHPSEVLQLMQGAGGQVVARKARQQVWSRRRLFGLRCDLQSLPPVRPAKFKVSMVPCSMAPAEFFEEELKDASGVDFLDVFIRRRMHQAGVKTLYWTQGPDGTPAYVQWLIAAANQERLHEFSPRRYPILSSSESVILEGAYTFVKHRRSGVMADGMGQLLRIASMQGAKQAFTYVGDDNDASLKGCARVGFVLDHVRINSRTAGFFRSAVRSVDASSRRMWTEATGS